MKTVHLKRLVVVADELLEDRLVREIEELGARGWTLTPVRGKGSRGMRSDAWEGRNVKIETIVSPETAGRILDRLAAEYFPHHAVIAYVDDVEVARGDKYV